MGHTNVGTWGFANSIGRVLETPNAHLIVLSRGSLEAKTAEIYLNLSPEDVIREFGCSSGVTGP